MGTINYCTKYCTKFLLNGRNWNCSISDYLGHHKIFQTSAILNCIIKLIVHLEVCASWNHKELCVVQENFASVIVGPDRPVIISDALDRPATSPATEDTCRNIAERSRLVYIGRVGWGTWSTQSSSVDICKNVVRRTWPSKCAIDRSQVEQQQQFNVWALVQTSQTPHQFISGEHLSIAETKR